MNSLFKYNILLLLSSFLIGCSTSKNVETDVEKAKELVAITKDQNYSSDKLLKFNQSVDELVAIIESSKNREYIAIKDSILEHCHTLDLKITQAMLLLEKKHGLDENNQLKNRESYYHVNKIFIVDGMAEELKTSIDKTVDKLSSIYDLIGIKIEYIDLPLKSTMESIPPNMSWESKYFKNMRARAVLPILRYYKKDNHDSKIFLLNLLALKN